MVGAEPVDDGRRLVLDGRRLESVDYSGLSLVQLSVAGSRLERCTFEGSTIDSASMGAGRERSEYTECSFDRCRIRFGPGGNARFVRCTFDDVRLNDWFCFAVELVDCVFSGGLERAYFNGSVPADRRNSVGRERNEISGNDFSRLELIDVDFRTGVDLRRQELPSGPDYCYIEDAARILPTARLLVSEWQDDSRRSAGMGLIGLLQDQVDDGQRDLFFRADDFKSIGLGVVREVAAIVSAK